ncbi:MAG: XVIPCD domain-containing protein, partial [Stenotrophomonas sp.]
YQPAIPATEQRGGFTQLAASAACLAKESRLPRIDHVALSGETGLVRMGENLFVVQGELNDPAHLRAHMRTDDALAKPVEQSLAQLLTLNEAQRQQQAPQAAQPEQVVAEQPRMI